MKKHKSFCLARTHLSPNLFFRMAILLILILGSACSNLQQKAGVSSWPSSTPEKQGMDSEQLLKLVDFMGKRKYNLHSFLVLRHGKLVLETYFPPFSAQDKHMLFSTTKSFISALVGIAVNEGKIKSVDQPILDFFPSVPIKNINEYKKNIHIHDLLNMTSGLLDDDIQMGESQDWGMFTLNQPCNIEPGTSFNYNSGNSQLLSAIVQQTSGVTAQEYAREKLFAPLEISDVYWAADPSGITLGGIGLMLTPRDMAKLGFLYLNQGQWKGKQIVPAEWVEASIQKNANEYAYLWVQTPNGYSTIGYGGQVIYVVPSKDLVVVSTAAEFGSETIAWNLTDSFVLSAIKSDQPLPESDFSKKLTERLAEITNPKAQEVPALPTMASMVNGKTLRLDENPLGWETAKLSFKDKQAWLAVTTTTNHKEQKFAVGLDGLYRKTNLKQVDALSIAKPEQRDLFNPFEFNFLLGVPMEGASAMKGEWENENEFLLTVQDTRDCDLEKLIFKFALPEVRIVWNSRMEDDNIMTVTGRLE